MQYITLSNDDIQKNRFAYDAKTIEWNLNK